ncbi:hypothetical protein MRB53_032304 [Persea americana]|uniref:Uncharacterized protein n=1 Tax=Persea americana TaxID=3435 RepID=A0ACC2KRY4_PERAE|nr:hypothetical protein MRB53_032304 [Persea americana]
MPSSHRSHLLLSLQTLQIKPTSSNLPNPTTIITSSSSSSSHHQNPTLDQTHQTHFNHSRKIPPGPHPTVHSPQFTSLITTYTNANRPVDALRIYAHLRTTNTLIDRFAIPSIIKACGLISTVDQGKEIQGFVLKSGLDWDVFLHNALVQMYSECGDIECARKVFDKMPDRDVVSWSTMIRSYGRAKLFNEALGLIREMQWALVKPSDVAVINMASVFADMAVLDMGRAMHCYAIKNSCGNSVSVNTALLDMYIKCGSVAPARRIFDQIVGKSVISWTAMIAGYIRCGDWREGLRLFCGMQELNVFANEITMLSMVLECGWIGELKFGKWLHGYMLRNGFELSFVLATALVDMYGKCGAIESARTVFDAMDERDVMSWTVLISGYTMAGRFDQAFELFVQMRDAKIKPNKVTMVNLLSLCAETGALDHGKWVHSFIDKEGIECDVVLATALVDMYAKCGDIDGSCGAFTRAPNKDVCIWNAMMGGLAMHGHAKEVLDLFSELERTRLQPNDVTFISVLHACSHAGLVEDGSRYFSRMVGEFGLVPKVEHYGCMVDLLGRAGLLNEAYETIKNMPIEPNIIVWGALLAACKLHRNVELAEIAVKQLLELEPQNCGYNVLMSNIYATANRWNDVADVRKSIKETRVKKAPGLSSIEVNGAMHKFVMGDCLHPKTKEIHEMLAEMNKKLRQAGYVANTAAVLINVDEEEKETALTYHSEKLAMAFGLISTAPNSPIRVVKNLRVCDDCHSVTKLLSKIYNRVIIVRDRNRFHHFRDGSCSCKDYW